MSDRHEEIFKNATLPPLLSYAPELDPVENIRDCPRANWPAISIFETFGRHCRRLLHGVEPRCGRHRHHPIQRYPTVRQNGHGIRPFI